ncbi:MULTISPECIES: flagellin N-terminal helical domain-containing protein [Priestia]|uniref:flagellin N-terminal helical domain-containing protein n=1 Tax=Priestia TaxID=2800373 RepID=UPI000BF57FC4|nr:flagellin [Priestia megaterium]MCA4155832.1 flagellin [Priestia megaterium]MCR8865128.1 flagellin [Priestia megaterium]MDN3228379.1 flagellin [Priestia megaterium]PFV95510.1 flagellin [Priestia megaterium]
MRINHNITALNTYRQFNNANNAQAKSMEKLSSGQRINSASDDAAGLAISEKMRGQIRGLDQASRNAQDGVSLIQTAEGALNETHDILQRMRELVVQAGNGTNKAEDLDAIQDEIGSLIEEIGGETGSKGISDRAQFNGRNLLDGSLDVTLQVGANAGQQVNLKIGNMSAGALGADTDSDGAADAFVNSINVKDFATTSFDDQLAIIDGAINQVSEQRSGLGATQNRLDHTINNLSTSSENLTASESRIRDVDYALAV